MARRLGTCMLSLLSTLGFGFQQQSVATPTCRERMGLPAFRQLKNQSCFCLGSAFEVASKPLPHPHPFHQGAPKLPTNFLARPLPVGTSIKSNPLATGEFSDDDD